MLGPPIVSMLSWRPRHKCTHQQGCYKLLEYLGSDAPGTLVTPMNKESTRYSRGNCFGYAVKPPAVCAWGLGVNWNISKKLPYRMVGRVTPTHVWPPQEKHKGLNVNGNLTSWKCFSGHAWDHKTGKARQHIKWKNNILLCANNVLLRI